MPFLDTLRASTCHPSIFSNPQTTLPANPTDKVPAHPLQIRCKLIAHPPDNTPSTPTGSASLSTHRSSSPACGVCRRADQGGMQGCEEHLGRLKFTVQKLRRSRVGVHTRAPIYNCTRWSCGCAHASFTPTRPTFPLHPPDTRVLQTHIHRVTTRFSGSFPINMIPDTRIL